MAKKYTVWNDELFTQAIYEAMKRIDTKQMPTHTELMKIEPMEIGEFTITGAALSNRVNFMGGFAEVAESMGLSRKGR